VDQVITVSYQLLEQSRHDIDDLTTTIGFGDGLRQSGIAAAGVERHPRGVRHTV
jgi:hypothetical protein